MSSEVFLKGPTIVGDTVSFKSGDKIVTGRVRWSGWCGIDVQVGDDYVTIQEKDIVETPKEGS